MGKHLNAMQLPERQRGVVLFIALIALVAMMLAGVALVRSVDTANVIAGNFAFKESTLSETDQATEQAITDLPGLVGAKGDTAVANQYLPVKSAVDSLGLPTGVDWSAVAVQHDGSTGNDKQYVVERMCDQVPAAGLVATHAPDQTNRTEVTDYCITAPQCSPGVSINSPPICVAGDINYRITTRVTGPRGTVSVVQSVVTR